MIESRLDNGQKHIKVNKKMGRKPIVSRELWKRRMEEYRIYAMGFSVPEIAEKFGVACKTIYDDFKAIQLLEKPIEERNEIQEEYNEILRRGFNDYMRAAPEHKSAFLDVLIKAISKKAKLFGLERDISINNTNVNSNQQQSKDANGYDKMDDDIVVKILEERKKAGYIKK